MTSSGLPERTADGRYLIIDGRRWRASDPGIPDQLRQELVDELMSARRAIRADGDRARPRVQDAKVALGERGRPWWEDATDTEAAERIEATIRCLLRKRQGRTICPSDVARVVGGANWRERMALVRQVAARLSERGEVVVTQRGAEVDGTQARGSVRIGPGSALDGAC